MNSATTKRNPLSRKIVSILALIIGIMSVFVGSKVLLEIDTKDYFILIWLVTYNVIFGAISVVVAFLIWRNSKYAKHSVVFILASHFSIFIYLKYFSATVAQESINAMLFRVSVWTLITFLSMRLPQLINKKSTF